MARKPERLEGVFWGELLGNLCRTFIYLSSLWRMCGDILAIVASSVASSLQGEGVGEGGVVSRFGVEVVALQALR